MEQNTFREACSFSSYQEILQGFMILFTRVCHLTLGQQITPLHNTPTACSLHSHRPNEQTSAPSTYHSKGHSLALEYSCPSTTSMCVCVCMCVYIYIYIHILISVRAQQYCGYIKCLLFITYGQLVSALCHHQALYNVFKYS